MQMWMLFFTSVERASFEMQRFPGGFAGPFLPGAECAEVFSSLGSNVSKELQNYPANWGHTQFQCIVCEFSHRFGQRKLPVGYLRTVWANNHVCFQHEFSVDITYTQWCSNPLHQGRHYWIHASNQICLQEHYSAHRKHCIKAFEALLFKLVLQHRQKVVLVLLILLTLHSALYSHKCILKSCFYMLDSAAHDQKNDFKAGKMRGVKRDLVT